MKRRLRMRSQYDFSKGVRGKYARRYSKGSNVVVLAPDLAKVFRTSQSVNKALRSLTKRAPSRPSARISSLSRFLETLSTSQHGSSLLPRVRGNSRLRRGPAGIEGTAGTVDRSPPKRRGVVRRWSPVSGRCACRSVAETADEQNRDKRLVDRTSSLAEG